MAPGTFDDPERALELSPSFLLVPVADVPTGLAIRDADPSRVKIFVDGFEVPNRLVAGRAVFFGGALSQLRRFDDGMDFAYGGATGGGLEVTTSSGGPAWLGLGATPQDVTLTAAAPSLGGYAAEGIRFGFLEPHRARSLDVTWDSHAEVQAQQTWRPSHHWQVAASLIGEIGDDGFTRLTMLGKYRNATSSAQLAASTLVDTTTETYDTRADLRHDIPHVAGLEVLQLRAGENTSVSTGDATHFDGGAWTAVGAMIGKDVVAVGGARLDVFDHQVALSPRGTVAAMFGHIGVGLTADAYRQAQADRDAAPERATEIVARVHRAWSRAASSLSAYYIDRSRILVDGRATGVGTAEGIELREILREGSWLIYGAIAASQATRADHPGAPDHAAELDIPLRFDALAQWLSGPWRIGGRVQLRSGLPYTPVTGAIYNADADTYTALYGTPDSARAPWRRELDLRVDRFYARRFHVYLDVALDGGVLGYTYSYDDSKRLAVRALPILPWLGISGTL